MDEEERENKISQYLLKGLLNNEKVPVAKK
jgi:hypothetical protein